ncbi:MAG: hypothetical protein QOI47_1674 [Actinomycetota bacterium]|jgi:hypothetical protein|nr:hypothetical protein [Actinomycetota bacterium]
MCTYVTSTTDVSGSGRAGADDAWFRVTRAVVYFDHPQDAPLDHALCIDVWGGGVTERVAVELDAASARRLAETILATLDHDEVKLLV